MNWADNFLRDVRYKKFVTDSQNEIFVFHEGVSPNEGAVYENDFKTNLSGVLRFNVSISTRNLPTFQLSVIEDDKIVADQTIEIDGEYGHLKNEDIYLDFPVKAFHKYTVRLKYVSVGGNHYMALADSIKGKIVDDLKRYIYREG